MTLLKDLRDSHASDIGHWLRMTLLFWIYARCGGDRADRVVRPYRACRKILWKRDEGDFLHFNARYAKMGKKEVMVWW